MYLVIAPGGTVRCIYAELVPLAELGSLQIARASHVEPDQAGKWLIDLSPVGGPVLRGFDLRSQALRAEAHWLSTNCF